MRIFLSILHWLSASTKSAFDFSGRDPNSNFTDEEKEALRTGIIQSKYLYIMRKEDLIKLKNEWQNVNPVPFDDADDIKWICIDGNHRLYWYKKLEMQTARCIVIRPINDKNVLMFYNAFCQLCNAENLLHSAASVHINDLERIDHLIGMLPRIVVTARGKGGIKINYDKLWEEYDTDLLGSELKESVAGYLVSIARHLEHRPLSREVIRQWLTVDIKPVCIFINVPRHFFTFFVFIF